MLSVVIQALKKLVMFLCTPFASRCLIHSDWALEVTLHSSSARRNSPCAVSPDRDSGNLVSRALFPCFGGGAPHLQSQGKAPWGRGWDSGRHLIKAVFVRKRLSLYEFTLWGRDLVSVVRIRESPFYKVFFLKKI